MSYGEEPVYNTGKIIYSILVGLFCIVMTVVVLAGVLGIPTYHAHQNQLKVEHMTELCQSKGYDGWADDAGDTDRPARSYCYNVPKG
jgi:hypothetical protein